MTNKQARRKSVNHWKRMLKLSVEDIRDGKESPSSENCALCHLYISDDCKGCPVAEKTGRILCQETPYKTAVDLYVQIKYGDHKDLKSFRKAVQKEIDFLEGLEL